MKTQSDETQNFNSSDYQDIIKELTPKFAPETTMTFKPGKPQNSRLRVFLRRSMKVAAIAIVAIVGGMILRPEPVHAVPQILDAASKQLEEAQSCIIEFSGKVTDKDDNAELYSFNPFGREIKGILSLLRDDENTYMRVVWLDGDRRKVQIFENDNYTLIENGHVVKRQKAVNCSYIYALLSAMEHIKTLGDDIVMEKQDDNIRLSFDSKKAIKFVGDFSAKNYLLTNAQVDFISAADHPITVLKTHSIVYNRPITKTAILSTTD